MVLVFAHGDDLTPFMLIASRNTVTSTSISEEENIEQVKLLAIAPVMREIESHRSNAESEIKSG